ncbi:MAG: DEAD/DEAH box helicase [Elainellaceae cyanobacterium]
MAILHGSWLALPQNSALFDAPEGTSTDHQPPEPEPGFVVWGEAWQPLDALAEVGSDRAHPYGMALADLMQFLQQLHQEHSIQWAMPQFPLATVSAGSKRDEADSLDNWVDAWAPRWRSLPVSLPTLEQDGKTIPRFSVAVPGDAAEPSASELTLQPWQISGLWLSADEALTLLRSLPLGIQSQASGFMGGDLRFWSHVARWHLDLLARSKFLPEFSRVDEQTAIATWQVLLDSATDQERLARFAEVMPAVCRFYGVDVTTQADDAETEPILPSDARARILSFLQAATDTQVRQAIAARPLPTSPFPKDPPLREWLQALGVSQERSPSETPRGLQTDAAGLDSLQSLLTAWIAPIQHQIAQQTATFRTCFILKVPAEHEKAWVLDYCLQSVIEPSFLVDAQTVWAHPVDRWVYHGRTIELPQETLLAGLGLASRLYPVLEASLQTQQPIACHLDPNQVYDFLKVQTWRLRENGLGVVLPPSLAQQDGFANRLGLSIKADPPKGNRKRLGLQSLLNFKWELSIGGQRISKAEFDRLVALDTPLVDINGEWVELRSPDIRAAQAFFESRKDQRSLSLEDVLRIKTGDTQMIDKLPVVNFETSGALEKLLTTLTTGNQSIEPLPTPASFQGTLRPYQQRGASWLDFLEQWGLGACLADDMGLGKTIQLIALLLHLKEQGALTAPTLLVCPTSVLGNWEREVKRFAPSLKVLVQHGEKRSQRAEFVTAAEAVDLVMTSYPLVYRDLKTLKRVSWRGIVLDEAQNIKNPQAKQSQALRELETQFRIALTGTPVENRLLELWSIMDFLNPGYLGPRNFFQRRFVIPIERYGDTASLKTLRSLVQPCILRRLKTDRTIIQDLPDKQENNVFCGLAPDQAALYQQLVDSALAEIESAEGIQRHGMILALLTKLKQVCNHPLLLGSKSKKVPLLSAQQSGKLQRLQAMLDELMDEGDRALIFTQFAEWGKLLKTYLEHQFQQEVLFLYGNTSKKQREAMVERFQQDPQAPRLFILSLKAGGVGLNLTRANHVFHFDRWWNPAVENQATDRVFRIGQTRNVQVHKFVCTGTLEERIHEIIESKKALSEQLVGTGENWLTDFDTAQLRNLLLLDRSAVIEDDED